MLLLPRLATSRLRPDFFGGLMHLLWQTDNGVECIPHATSSRSLRRLRTSQIDPLWLAALMALISSAKRVSNDQSRKLTERMMLTYVLRIDSPMKNLR